MHRPMTNAARLLAAALAAAVLTIGCASRGFVRKQDDLTKAELTELGTSVEQVQTDVETLESTVGQQGQEIDQLSTTSREALERAMAAGKLAEGKFLYETVLTDEGVRFGFEQASLGDDARLALDAFATQISERNQNVYVEIQGHTDASGEEGYNLMLGERRAESVRRYLSLEHGLPLHRMAVISYGEAAPIDDNSTREGRARNRRVALVVLQ
jgi:outer membrane protein OmpA-like peptidoglycan-associated protein